MHDIAMMRCASVAGTQRQGSTAWAADRRELFGSIRRSPPGRFVFWSKRAGDPGLLLMVPLGISFFGDYNPPRNGPRQSQIVAGTTIRTDVRRSISRLRF